MTTVSTYHGWQVIKGVWTKIHIDNSRHGGGETRQTFPGREWFINARWVQKCHQPPKHKRNGWHRLNESRRNFFVRYW